MKLLQPLVGELRSHKLCSVNKKTKKAGGNLMAECAAALSDAI